MAITYQDLLEHGQVGYICDKECLLIMDGRWGNERAVQELQDKIDAIIGRIEREVRVERFYIGKTYVDAFNGQLDRGDPETWDTRGINSRWDRDQYNNLIVLTVVTRDVSNGQHPEGYTLDLEEELIRRYFQRGDRRLANQGVNQGPPGENRHDGYVLYLEVQLRRQRARAR